MGSEQRERQRGIAIAWVLASAACCASGCDAGGDPNNNIGSGGAGAASSGGSSAAGMAIGGAGSGGAAGLPSGAGGAVGNGGNGGATAAAGSGGFAGGNSGAGGGGATDAGAPITDAGEMHVKLPAVDSVDVAGPFETIQDLASGPQGASGVFYPVELGKNGLQHPIFIWGCGGGSDPSQYLDHLNRLASHGFVSVADVTTTDADGAPLKASLEWIIGENERAASIFYHKLDVTKIAAGGHSIGSVNAFAIADDPRLTTTIHVAGGSLDNDGALALKLTHPAAYICAEQDVFGNVEKALADYAVTTVPVFFTVMTGVDHVGAAREGLPAIVAWLRWHLGGETERAAMFLQPDGEFCTGKYVSQSKNWK